MTTDIQYNGSVIASLKPGESSTIECSGSRMRGDIVISAAYCVDIIYNGALIASLEKGQTATINGAGKIMLKDMTVHTLRKTTAVLGRAVLSYALLGHQGSVLTSPTVRLTAGVKLTSPVIYLTEQLGRPRIYIVTENETGDPSISPPANVYVRNNTLAWYYVDGADSFIVYIEDTSGNITTVDIDTVVARTLDLTPYCGAGTWTIWVCAKVTVDGVDYISEPSESVTYVVEFPKLDAPAIYLEMGKLDTPVIRLEQYTELAYLESTGTQYIDTKIIPTINSKIMLKGVQGTNDCALFGVSDVFYCFDNSNRTYYGLAGKTGNFSHRIGGEEIELIMSKEDGVIINGTTYADLSSASTTIVANYSVVLFGRRANNSGSVAKLGQNRLYYCKVWDGNTLVRDFIPVLDSNDVPCMFDKVSGEFFYNQGTGAFQYGTK